MSVCPSQWVFYLVTKAVIGLQFALKTTTTVQANLSGLGTHCLIDASHRSERILPNALFTFWSPGTEYRNSYVLFAEFQRPPFMIAVFIAASPFVALRK